MSDGSNHARGLTSPHAEIIPATNPDSPLALLCEHASASVPPPWILPVADRWLLGTHWAFDPGAEELTLEIAGRFGAVAVVSRFSRLLVDPNRPEAAHDLIRTHADGHAIELNRSVDEEEYQRRRHLWRAYHATADQAVGSSTAEVVLAVHTFTPSYEGSSRDVEVGVLFDTEEDLARELLNALKSARIEARPNEPYSGKSGLMYSVDRHARTHRRHPIEIEVRQDLVRNAPFRTKIVDVLRDLFGKPTGHL